MKIFGAARADRTATLVPGTQLTPTPSPLQNRVFDKRETMKPTVRLRQRTLFSITCAQSMALLTTVSRSGHRQIPLKIDALERQKPAFWAILGRKIRLKRGPSSTHRHFPGAAQEPSTSGAYCGKAIGGEMPSSSGFGPGIQLVFCAATTSHSPPRFSTTMVKIPMRGLRAERSSLRSPVSAQLQWSSARSGRRK
jgi:hypothetical protein